MRGPESWRQGDKAQLEQTQEGHAQQGELSPEGGQVRGGQWEPGGVPGEEKETIRRGCTSPHDGEQQLQEGKRGSLWACFYFSFLNRTFIKHQL